MFQEGKGSRKFARMGEVNKNERGRDQRGEEAR